MVKLVDVVKTPGSPVLAGGAVQTPATGDGQTGDVLKANDGVLSNWFPSRSTAKVNEWIIFASAPAAYCSPPGSLVVGASWIFTSWELPFH